MLPTFEPGQLVVAVAPIRAIEIGDVVMVKHEGLEKIKRVAQLRAEGELYLLGDNPLTSIDSRRFGWLPTSQVRGKVIWPRQPKAADYSTTGR
jgi:type IV secretory pathway protease TraF